MVQFDSEVEDRLRLLGFQTRTRLVEIVRLCVDRALPEVEKYLLQKPGLRTVAAEDVQRLNRMMTTAKRKQAKA